MSISLYTITIIFPHNIIYMVKPWINTEDWMQLQGNISLPCFIKTSGVPIIFQANWGLKRQLFNLQNFHKINHILLFQQNWVPILFHQLWSWKRQLFNSYNFYFHIQIHYIFISETYTILNICQPHWIGHGQHLNLKWIWILDIMTSVRFRDMLQEVFHKTPITKSSLDITHLKL